jgi:hypothetical protein
MDRSRDDALLLARVHDVQAAIEGAPGPGIHTRLQGLETLAHEMRVDLCAFVRDHAPDFLPYYYLLEGAAACDDPNVPLWVRDQVRAERYGVPLN